MVEPACRGMSESLISIDSFTAISSLLEENNSSENNLRSQYAQVVFHDLCDTYPTDSDLSCRYTLTDSVRPQQGDRIALYRVGWFSVSDFVTFEWAPPPLPQPHASHCQVVFKECSLPKAENELYQLCYVTVENVVAGASIPFGFKRPHESELTAVEDPANPGLIVFRSRIALLQDQLHKVEAENDSLREQLNSLGATDLIQKENVKESNKRIVNLEAVLAEGKMTEAETEKKTESLKDDLAAMSKRLALLEESLRESSERNQSLEAALADAIKVEREKESLIEQLVQKSATLQTKLNDACKKNEHLEAALAEGKKRELETVADTDSLRNELTGLRARLSMLEESLKESSERNLSLEAALADAIKNETEREILVKKNSNLSIVAEMMKENLTDACKKIENLNVALVDRKKVEEENAKLYSMELADLLTIHKTVEDRLKEATERNASMEAALADGIKVGEENVIKELAEVSTKLATTENKLKVATEKIASMQEGKLVVDAEKSSLSKLCVELADKVATLQTVMSSARNCGDVIAELARTKQLLRERESIMITECLSKSTEPMSEMDSLSDEVALLKREITNMAEEHMSFKDEISRVIDDLELKFIAGKSPVNDEKSGQEGLMEKLEAAEKSRAEMGEVIIRLRHHIGMMQARWLNEKKVLLIRIDNLKGYESYSESVLNIPNGVLDEMYSMLNVLGIENGLEKEKLEKLYQLKALMTTKLQNMGHKLAKAVEEKERMSKKAEDYMLKENVMYAELMKAKEEIKVCKGESCVLSQRCERAEEMVRRLQLDAIGRVTLDEGEKLKAEISELRAQLSLENKEEFQATCDELRERLKVAAHEYCLLWRNTHLKEPTLPTSSGIECSLDVAANRRVLAESSLAKGRDTFVCPLCEASFLADEFSQFSLHYENHMS